MKNLLITISIVLGFHCNAQMQNNGNDKINQYINNIMTVHEIPGMALAVIEDGVVVHKGYYGKANLENEISVDSNTIFRIYSTTKLITATGIFKLIENGKITLEDKISEYLDNLPKKWQEIKVNNLLTHSSGLPDLIKYDSAISDEELMSKLSKDQMDFNTGDQFRYNQTNYWFLTQIIERVTGLTFEDFILKNQFSSEKDGVLFSSNSSVSIPNRADKYYFDNKTKKYEKTNNNDGIRAHSGNGLNITLDKFIRWNQGLDADYFLKKETKSLMWNPFDFNNGKDKFLYGWGIYPVNNIHSYGFTGGGVSGFRKFTKNDITVILLTNGFKYFPVHNHIINHVAGIVENNLIDGRTLSEEAIILAFLQKDIAKAIKEYNTIKTENLELKFESTLNSLGYTLIRNGRIKDGLEVFKLNVREHPDSWNVWDSLAEGYEMTGDSKNAIINYRKSVDLNPDNHHGIEKLKALIE